LARKSSQNVHETFYSLFLAKGAKKLNPKINAGISFVCRNEKTKI
jgi:hypothetical protein